MAAFARSTHRVSNSNWIPHSCWTTRGSWVSRWRVERETFYSDLAGLRLRPACGCAWCGGNVANSSRRLFLDVMCGRYRIKDTDILTPHLRQTFGLPEWLKDRNRFNIAPSQDCPVIIMDD